MQNHCMKVMFCFGLSGIFWCGLTLKVGSHSCDSTLSPAGLFLAPITQYLVLRSKEAHEKEMVKMYTKPVIVLASPGFHSASWSRSSGRVRLFGCCAGGSGIVSGSGRDLRHGVSSEPEQGEARSFPAYSQMKVADDVEGAPTRMSRRGCQV